jgi:hypothetical protein
VGVGVTWQYSLSLVYLACQMMYFVHSCAAYVYFFCEIWGSHSTIAQDSSPLEYYAVSAGKDLLTFRTVKKSGISSWTVWPWRWALQFFYTFVTICLVDMAYSRVVNLPNSCLHCIWRPHFSDLKIKYRSLCFIFTCTTAYQPEIWQDLRATGVELLYGNPAWKTVLKTRKKLYIFFLCHE